MALILPRWVLVYLFRTEITIIHSSTPHKWKPHGLHFPCANILQCDEGNTRQRNTKLVQRTFSIDLHGMIFMYSSLRKQNIKYCMHNCCRLMNDQLIGRCVFYAFKCRIWRMNLCIRGLFMPSCHCHALSPVWYMITRLNVSLNFELVVFWTLLLSSVMEVSSPFVL